MNISVLCFNRHGDLVMGSVDAKAEDGHFLTYEGKHYQVVNAQPKSRGMLGYTKVVDFVEWKENKKEAV